MDEEETLSILFRTYRIVVLVIILVLLLASKSMVSFSKYQGFIYNPPLLLPFIYTTEGVVVLLGVIILLIPEVIVYCIQLYEQFQKKRLKK